MPDYIRAADVPPYAAPPFPAGECGLVEFDTTITLSDTDTGKIIYSPPLVSGDWVFVIDGITDLTEFLVPTANMLRVKITQRGACGMFDRVLSGTSVLLDPAFIFPCFNDASCPDGAIGGEVTPYANRFAAANSESPGDCCSGTHIYTDPVTLDPTATPCPIEACNLVVFEINTVKQPGSGTFRIAFHLTGSLLVPP